MLKYLHKFFSDLYFTQGWFSKGSNMIIFNDMRIKGNNITINNGRIIVDGVEYTNDNRTIIEKIIVEGNVANLTVDAGNVHVNGVTGDIEIDAGNIEVNGNVNGFVSTEAGNITVGGNVAGSVHSDCGNVRVDSQRRNS